MVGQILLQENKILQLEEINDIEKLMPDMIVEIITPKIKGFSKYLTNDKPIGGRRLLVPRET